MLRKFVLRHNFLHRKGFPVRAQSLLRIKVDERATKHKESSSTSSPTKVAKVARKHVVVRRSTAPPKFQAGQLSQIASLVKNLSFLQQELKLTDAMRSSICSVVTQLRRCAPEAEAVAQAEARPSDEEMDEASMMMTRVMQWNEQMAAFIDARAFNGEPAVSSYFMVRNYREMLDFSAVHKGKIVCSVDTLYNTLLQALAAEGRSYEAVKVLDWIRADGMKPSYQSYTTVLEAMGHEKTSTDFRSEVKLVEQMKADGYALEDLLLVDDYTRKSFVKILRVVFRVEPGLKMRSKKMDPEAERYAQFPVLRGYRETEVSRVNPLHGVLSQEELFEGFKKQVEAEQVGFTTIDPIAGLKVDVSLEKQQLLREKLINEREMWRAVLSFALSDFIRRGKLKQKSITMAAISFLTLDEGVDIMLQEIDYLVSESATQYSYNYVSHRRLGNRVYDIYLQKRRQKEKHAEKFASIYADYMPQLMGNEERDPELVNIADVWETVAAPHLKGDSLNLKMPEWNNHTCYRIGYLLHQLMYTHLKFNTKGLSRDSKRDEAPVIYESLEQHGAKLEKFIKIHPVLLRWFHIAGLPPLRFSASELPMLCPPVPWVDPERQRAAGFFFSQDYASKLIRSVTPSEDRLGAFYLKGVPRREYSPVLDALNVLSSVAWRVNGPVLDTVTRVFKSGGDRQLLRKLNLPPAPHDLPDPPAYPDQSLPFLQRRAAMQAVQEAQKERSELFSLWNTELYRLSIANIFRDSTFWFPHSMDFRGRVYPCPPHFNYMGSDVSRSLLTFAKGRPLGQDGLDWLMIHLVNLTGLKKRASNKERLSFAHSIVDDILDSAERPLNGRGWWMQEDDPWQVLACCMEIANALKSADHRHYVSNFPVHQDGSCNGLQHYAALGRDCLGADCVNLTPREKPQDVYADVGELVEEQRRIDAAQGVAVAQRLEGYVKRKVIKQSVMTTVYGVTFFGAQLQVARQLREFEEVPPDLVREGAAYLARLTLASIGKIFTSSVQIQDWLVASARVITSKRRTPVAWSTPLGLPVMQPYAKDRFSAGRFLCNIRPDVAKQARAFPPNLVHSYDATHMALTALSCYRQGITFAAVHDCFWTHAADVPVMGAACREQFVALHEQPLLQHLSASLIETFQEDQRRTQPAADATLRSVPERGDLNIKTVLDSEYFFS